MKIQRLHTSANDPVQCDTFFVSGRAAGAASLHAHSELALVHAQPARTRTRNGAWCHTLHPHGGPYARCMKAIWVTAHGGPEVLELREGPDPAPQEGEVRVRRVRHVLAEIARVQEFVALLEAGRLRDVGPLLDA